MITVWNWEVMMPRLCTWASEWLLLDEKMKPSRLRSVADMVGVNVALDESSSVNAEVLGSTHSCQGDGNPTSTCRRHGYLRRYLSSWRRTHRLQVRRPGGHIASLQKFNHPKIAMTTEPLAWWRFNQEKWSLDPESFECRRWVRQLEN